MLLEEPFDPLKEQQKKSFFSRFQFFASKTKRALNNIKTKRQLSRQMQTLLRNQQFMLPPPPPPGLPGPPQPPMYCCYGSCYDPYVSAFMFGPPLPPPPLPLPILCIHFDSHMDDYRFPQYIVNSSPTSNPTIYNSARSFEEKEQVDEDEDDDDDDISFDNSLNSNAGHSTIPPTLTRRYSEMLYDRREFRPTLAHRWNSSSGEYYL